MNYRHAFHAGGFADVLKHTVFCRVLAHLRLKPAAFRVLDSHAGAGTYDLGGEEAGRTGEWRGGIGRIAAARLPEPARELMAPYLDAVAALNPPGRIGLYPGSPALALALMRPQDRLIACELEPNAAASLTRTLRGDPRATALPRDGWNALAAYLPPKERRGIVLIDPPFEQPGEFGRLAQGFETAQRRWATGIYLLWYPIKDPADVAGLVRRLRQFKHAKMLRVELIVAPRAEDGRLRGSGLIVINPPWLLHEELTRLLPMLTSTLGGSDATSTLGWLVD